MLIIRLAPFVSILYFVACGLHTHNTKGTSKENVEYGVHISRESKHYEDGKHSYHFDHESILGSHDLADEFETLPPEEAKRRLRMIARAMDANQDKYVDKVELTNWVLHSFKKLTEAESLEDLESEDEDENGKITWEEHIAETFGIYDDDIILSHDQSSEEEAQMLENDRELFKAADLNGDGILDKFEYPAFSHPEEFEHMHEVVYRQAMRKRDEDKDGFLSFAEFVMDNHGADPVHTTEHYIMEKDRFDNDYDLDGDKKLNREEVLLWLIPNNMEAAASEADHLIKRSDTNKDGKLTTDEIIDHHEVFVGSEATDFGEHLQNNRFIDEL